MCGIAGIFSNSEIDLRRRGIEKMTDSMVHRGPDGFGYYHDHVLSFGHRRLAIIDLSEGGHQPQQDAEGKVVITFNGEIFNYQELKKELHPYPFKSKSDTEVIIAAYLRWGYDFVKKIKGQFALAIWDKVKEEIILARDRMGEKPLYYFSQPGLFIFASEIRALLSTNLIPQKIDQIALADYLQFQSVNEPLTLVENVYLLPAASFGVYKKGSFEIHSYYLPGANTDKAVGAENHNSKIKDLFRNAVKSQMQSDVPLGAFLSGGIDSSAVVGQMAELSDQPIHTFNVAFEESDFDESYYASLIAKKFNTRHTKILLDPNEFVRDIDPILASVDNPSGDGPNSFIVSRAVKKQGITVALSGIGGDDLFAGYDGFKNYYSLEKFKYLFKIPGLLKTIFTIRQKLSGKAINEDKAKLLFSGKPLNLVDFYTLSRMLFTDADLTSLLNKPASHVLKNNLSELLSKLPNLPILSKYSVCELSGYTRNVLLRDSDGMSMSQSLEVRCPFLDYELIDYVLHINDKLKYPTTPKKLLVSALGDLLPGEVVHRKKMGFTLPWEHWMKNELQSLVENKILNLSKRDVLNGPQLMQIYQRFKAGEPSIKWSKIWLLVALESWLENNKF